MNGYVIRTIVFAFLLSVILTPASAITIEEPLTGLLTGFGSSEVYRGQTFTIPETPGFAETLTVYVGPTPDRDARFRILLTETDTVSGFNPTRVFFESQTFELIPSVQRNPDPFTVDLGGIRLEPDQLYAWILDHFAEATDTVISISTGIGDGDLADGFGFSFPNGPFLPQGTREDHFASNNWFVESELDFAFSLTVTPVPIPAAIWLFASALGLLGGVRWKAA